MSLLAGIISATSRRGRTSRSPRARAASRRPGVRPGRRDARVSFFSVSSSFRAQRTRPTCSAPRPPRGRPPGDPTPRAPPRARRRKAPARAPRRRVLPEPGDRRAASAGRRARPLGSLHSARAVRRGTRRSSVFGHRASLTAVDDKVMAAAVHEPRDCWHSAWRRDGSRRIPRARATRRRTGPEPRARRARHARGIRRSRCRRPRACVHARARQERRHPGVRRREGIVPLAQRSAAVDLGRPDDRGSVGAGRRDDQEEDQG